MKKSILKTISFFLLIMLIYSCSNNKNTLTEESVLEQLKQYETEQPIVFKTSMNSSFIKTESELFNASGYYQQLYNDGYIEAVLRSDITNPTSTSRPYEVVLTQKAEPFILERNGPNNIKVRSLEFNAVAVKDIRMLSDFKAEVDVEYNKTKTPFHNSMGKDMAPSGKEYPNNSYIKTLEFRKNQKTNEWKYPIKVHF